MKSTSISALPARPTTAKIDLNRYVDVSGTRVRYMEAGRGHTGAALLLVHGYNGSCDYWHPRTLAGLAAERHVIALDLPGNGLSGKLREHTLDAYVDFIPAFLDSLGLDTVDLLGHSMGGQVAIAAVAAHPRRFRKLVLVDSAGLPELVKLHWLAPFKMLTDSCMRQVSLYPSYIKIALRARTPWEGLDIVRNRGISRSLKSLAIPTLIIWGSRDRVVPLEHGAFMAKHIQGARLVIMRGAGHMPFYQKPEEFNRLVLTFLRLQTEQVEG
ncbi:MAG: alpha/beta fold hydrolase [Chloroflexota bacterium]|nr:alpha/beta fold hydrolase [Chloroflexota bacterium]